MFDLLKSLAGKRRYEIPDSLSCRCEGHKHEDYSKEHIECRKCWCNPSG